MAKKLKDITMIKINPKGFDPKKYVELDPTYGNNNKNMVEEKANSVVITFGRFSPPTTGHEKLVAKITQEAKKRSADPLVYASHTFDKKKNPLDYNTKVKHVRKMFPRHARRVMINKKVRTAFDAAQFLFDKGYKNVVMVVGSDRVTEFDTLLNKYNGKKAQHGFYNFNSIVVSSLSLIHI